MNKKAFFDTVRTSLFGGRMTPEQVKGCDSILDEMASCNDPRWTAYALATAYHETGGKMVPIVENLNYSEKGLRATFPTRVTPADAARLARKPEAIANHVYGGRMGNTAPGDGWKYRGRGLVQITGKDNYTKYGIADNPDKALDVATAVHIMSDGMINGKFTGVSLRDYFNAKKTDWVGARKIINGTDKADKIAREGKLFYAALLASSK